MWNWNSEWTGAIDAANEAFNWTNVELKPWIPNFAFYKFDAFNWTNVELKRVSDGFSCAPLSTFNWTNVELKQVSSLIAQYCQVDF